MLFIFIVHFSLGNHNLILKLEIQNYHIFHKTIKTYALNLKEPLSYHASVSFFKFYFENTDTRRIFKMLFSKYHQISV